MPSINRKHLHTYAPLSFMTLEVVVVSSSLRLFEDKPDGITGEAVERFVLQFDEVVVDHKCDGVFLTGDGGFSEIDKRPESRVEAAQVELALFVSQFAMLCADESVVERQVAVLALPQRHTGLVVEVYDVFPHLRGGIIPMGHDNIGRME